MQLPSYTIFSKGAFRLLILHRLLRFIPSSGRDGCNNVTFNLPRLRRFRNVLRELCCSCSSTGYRCNEARRFLLFWGTRALWKRSEWARFEREPVSWIWKWESDRLWRIDGRETSHRSFINLRVLHERVYKQEWADKGDSVIVRVDFCKYLLFQIINTLESAHFKWHDQSLHE